MYQYVFHGNKGWLQKYQIVIRSFYVLPTSVIFVVHVHTSGLQTYITFHKQTERHEMELPKC